MNSANESIANADPSEVDVCHVVGVVFPVPQVDMSQWDDVGTAVRLPECVKLFSKLEGILR